jgi:hypothetical protein
MRLTLPEKHFLLYSSQTGTHQYFYLKIKLLRIKFFSALDNHGGSDLTDGSTGPVADPLQVGKDLFWNLYVDAPRKVLGVESKATDIFAFINHCLAPNSGSLAFVPNKNRKQPGRRGKGDYLKLTAALGFLVSWRRTRDAWGQGTSRQIKRKVEEY